MLRDDEIASIRATVNQYLPDTALNSRTGLSSACRLKALPTAISLPHFPPQQTLTEFRVTLPDDTATKAGDTLSITDHEDNASLGVFYVRQDVNPDSYGKSNRALCFQQRLADGTLNLGTNQTIQFQQQRRSTYYLSDPLPANIQHSAQLDPEVIRVLGLSVSDYVAWFDPTLVESGGHLFAPLTEDYLLCPAFTDHLGHTKNCKVSAIVPNFDFGGWLAVFGVPGQ